MGLFDKFKKQQVEEVEPQVAPNLMASDPAAGEGVSLMASDPINTAPEAPVAAPDIPLMEEEPGIEEQLTREEHTPEPAPILIDELKPVEEPEPTFDAFSMPAPVEETPTPVAPQAPPVAPDLAIAPKEEQPEVTPLHEEISNTNKFCKSCGTPNPLLNKFCVSCGDEM